MTFIQNRISFLATHLPLYLQGIRITIVLSILGVLFGTILGTLIAIMRLGKNKVLSKIAIAYVEIIRGTPLLVQLSILVFTPLAIVPPEATFLRSKPLWSVVAISINSSAYVSEIIRSGIKSIDYGQTEAARSLGMTESQTMKFIILPQAVKNILPALGNEFVTLIKESAIVSFVALHDIMYYANAIRGATYKPFEPFLIAAIIYFILTFSTSRLLGKLERKLDASDSRS
ncbi:MAG: amino acid ABC transporter permease [Tissierellia bacterium]|nr:amino acid ABC transporter permease [Tissierellia bacterium]